MTNPYYDIDLLVHLHNAILDYEEIFNRRPKIIRMHPTRENEIIELARKNGFHMTPSAPPEDFEDNCPKINGVPIDFNPKIHYIELE